MSHFCTLSDQPVTFNALADWSLSSTADKISGTKLACHSRRSNSRLRPELREKITSCLHRPQNLNTSNRLRPKRSYQREQFHRRLTGYWYVILQMQTFFPSSPRLHSRATAMYCRNMVIKKYSSTTEWRSSTCAWLIDTPKLNMNLQY